MQQNSPFRFYLLGELTVVSQGEILPSLPTTAQHLLAAMLLNPRRRRRERLAALLYPDVPERKGRQRLSHILWLLRKSLPRLPIEATRDEVYLVADALWLDVDAFRSAAEGPEPDCWLTALNLYRGDLLEGLYADWLLEERESLYLDYVRLSHRTCEVLIQEKSYREALPIAERLVQRDPFDERALRTLMSCYRAAGRRGAALAAYDRFAASIADELSSTPQPATQALAQALRATVHRSPACLEEPPPGEELPGALIRRTRDALVHGNRAMIEACLNLLRRHGEAVNLERCLLEIDIALFLEDYPRVDQLLDRCVLPDAVERVRAAQLALGRRQHGLAQETVSEALLLTHETGNLQELLSALLVSTDVQDVLGASIQALRTADRALALARQIGSPVGIAQALIAQGRGQVHQGRYDQALARFQEARSVALEHGLRYQLADALSGIRQVQSNTNALKEALVSVQEELLLWRDMGIVRREAEALEGEAMIRDLLGQPSASLRALSQAREISERLGIPLRLAINQYNLACSLLYHDDRRAPAAISASRQALDAFRRLRQPGREVAALTILGYAFWVNGQYREAIAMLREAYAACQRIGELARLPELLAYQGLAYLGLERDREALEVTRRAVLALAQGEVSDEVVPEIYYAHAVALASNDLEDQALSYLSQAYSLLLEAAAQFQDEQSRQAFFHHNPTLRRLMEELVARGLAPDPDAGRIARTVPSAMGEDPRQIVWTIDAGPADAALKQAQGAIALRRTRLARLLREARAQGADPSTADLAEVLGVSRRTVQRDLIVLRSS